MAFTDTGQQIVSALIRAAEAAPADPAARLQALWANPKKFGKHVHKRLHSGEVSSPAEYALKTFEVLASAQKITVAEPRDLAMHPTAKVQVVADGWVVLLSFQGRIVTAYPFDAQMLQFEERHRNMGDSVHEHHLSQEHCRLLAQLFA